MRRSQDMGTMPKQIRGRFGNISGCKTVQFYWPVQHASPDIWGAPPWKSAPPDLISHICRTKTSARTFLVMSNRNGPITSAAGRSRLHTFSHLSPPPPVPSFMSTHDLSATCTSITMASCRTIPLLFSRCRFRRRCCRLLLPPRAQPDRSHF